MESRKTLLLRATLAISRRLNELNDDNLEAIAENEKLLDTIINDNLGTQLRREALFATDVDIHSVDDELIDAVIQYNEGYSDEMDALCRTELVRDVVELRRRLNNALYDAEKYERKYRTGVKYKD
jgi:hypothetical protein